MKVNRQNTETERKESNAFWLHEFAYDLEKNAGNIDYLKDYMDKKLKTKKFNSIDEKLADIKERVGFDLAKKITDELEKTSSTAQTKCCDTIKKECSCQIKVSHLNSREDDIASMANILKYIEDMIKQEPHIDAPVVLSRCKNEPDLHFITLEKKIDQNKLLNYINELLETNTSYNPESIKYTPVTSDSDDASNDVAEYYNHAESNHS